MRKSLLTKSIILIGLLTTFQAFAQSTGSTNKTEATLGDWYQKLRESPLGLFYNVSIGTERNRNLGEDPNKGEYDIAGIQTAHFARMSLKLSPKDRISIAGLWLNAYGKNYETDDFHLFTDFDYRRSGILNQKDHGINLSAGFKQRIFNERYRVRDNAQNEYGQTGVSVSISRSLTDKLSFSTSAQYRLFNRSSGAKNTLRRDMFLFTPTFAYQLGGKWSLSLSNTIIHQNSISETGDRTWMDSTLSLGYSWNKYVSIAFGASTGFGGGVFKAKDGRMFSDHIEHAMIYSIDIGISAF